MEHEYVFTYTRYYAFSLESGMNVQLHPTENYATILLYHALMIAEVC